jgi:hypothetical protein
MSIAPLTVGRSIALAKNQLEQDARGSADEETALAELGQFHRGIGDAEGLELVAIVVVAPQAEADVVDRLAAAGDGPAAARMRCTTGSSLA